MNGQVSICIQFAEVSSRQPFALCKRITLARFQIVKVTTEVPAFHPDFLIGVHFHFDTLNGLTDGTETVVSGVFKHTTEAHSLRP